MKKGVLKTIGSIILAFSIACALLTTVAVAIVRKNVSFSADEMLFEAAKGDTVTHFFANASTVAGEYVPVEIEAMTMGGEIKSYYPLDSISSYIKDGFVAVEDKEFYSHDGVNLRRTVMALANHLFKFGKTFGASTITQQVIKNITGDSEQTAMRKLLEIARAVRIEQSHTKDEILELYLNILPLGENVVGVGMGARHYFDKESSDLLPEEAAVLIALANAPSAYNPHNNPERCLQKRNIILSEMREDGVLSDSEYDRAIATPLSVTPKETSGGAVYSWFVETVIDDMSADYSKKHGISPEAARMLLLASGLNVYTTQNVKVQEILDEYFGNMDNFPSECKSGLDFSMVVLDPYNADLLGIVGSVGEKKGNLITNHATAKHTPASALKPIALYAPLLESGEISWSTVLDDVPLEFIDGTRPYPANSPNVYSGLISVKEALTLSKNTVAMRLYKMLGSEQIYANLKENYGVNLVRSEYNASGQKVTDLAPAPLALGQLSRGVGLRKLTEAYTAFSADGVINEGRSYLKVSDASGNLILEKEAQSKRIYSESTARIMNQMLMNVTDHGTAKSVTLADAVDTAGKTGTSSGNLEKLFVGYTPYLAGGIRCSYNDSKTPIEGVSSAHLAVWDAVMTELHGLYIGEHDETVRSFSTEGLVYVGYCKDSGKLPSDNCILDPRGDRIEYGYFMPQNMPREHCDTHVLVDYDIETGGVAHSGCPVENIIQIALVAVPERRFPVEVTVLDAEYAYRRQGADTLLGDSFDVPYFYYSIPDGEFVGTGERKKQFNHACYLHD